MTTTPILTEQRKRAAVIVTFTLALTLTLAAASQLLHRGATTANGLTIVAGTLVMIRLLTARIDGSRLRPLATEA